MTQAYKQLHKSYELLCETIPLIARYPFNTAEGGYVIPSEVII